MRSERGHLFGGQQHLRARQRGTLTQFDLTINLKTAKAKALGLTIPPPLRARTRK
jgi:hypothetical protein